MKSAKVKSRIPKQAVEGKKFWQKHIAAHATSGVSKSAYCQLNQVDYARFVYWSRKEAAISSSSPLIAVKLQPTADEARNNALLCTLVLKNGDHLHIHDAQVLPIILGRLN